MSADDSMDTWQMHGMLDRIRAGDPEALNELCLRVMKRMEHLARVSTRKFPRIRGLADSNDVLQNALLRLLRSLQAIRPENTRQFFQLAAMQVRRELIDLARRVAARPDLTALPITTEDSQQTGLIDPPAPHTDPDDLESWCRFHQAVETLPTAEREVISLVVYHGWTQQRIAELMQVDERTVRRRRDRAIERLCQHLGGKLPDLPDDQGASPP